MEREIVVFAIFGGLSIAFNALEDKAHLFREVEGFLHYLAHPNMLHALRDYSIHLAVYSGYILGAH